MIFLCIQEMTCNISPPNPLGEDLEDDYINSKDKHISTEDQILGEKSNENKN